jgi:hypothetical protein
MRVSKMKRIEPPHLPLYFLVLVIGIGVTASPASALARVPPNDDFANAADLGNGLTASASGSNLWATAEPGEPGRASGPAMASVWYRWTAPQSGVVRVDTCRSNFDTTLAVFRGAALGALGRIAANDEGCGNRSALQFYAIAGTTYFTAVDGYREAQGSIELKLRFLNTPSNDDLANAVDLGNKLTASASGTNRDATIEAREPDHHGRRAMASVWYRWTSPARRMMRIETCGSDFDTVLAVYAGAGLDALRRVASDDDTCGTQSRTKFGAVAGATYYIAVDSYGQAQGSIELKLTKVKRKTKRRTAAVDRLPSHMQASAPW